MRSHCSFLRFHGFFTALHYVSGLSSVPCCPPLERFSLCKRSGSQRTFNDGLLSPRTLLPSTLEPATCVRNADCDNESLSTTETITEQSLPMRGDSHNKNTEARVARSSGSRFHPLSRNPRRSQSTANKSRTMALQRTAPGLLRVSRWLLPAEPAAQPARHAPPRFAVSELESLIWLSVWQQENRIFSLLELVTSR